MKRSLRWTHPLVLATTLSFLCIGASFADTQVASVHHDGRFIYYDTAWSHFSPADQVEIVQKSMQLLKGELSGKLAAIPGVKTLSNATLSPAALDELVNKAQQLVTISESRGQDLLPAGFMIFGGGSVEAAFLAKGKISGDIGIVVLPTKETRVDTLDGSQTSTYFKLQWNTVVTPHGYGAIGPAVAAGPSGSVGVDFIFGNLNKVSDFKGIVFGAGAEVKFLAGADAEVVWVHNVSADKNFLMLGAEVDFGAEAGATIDGEGGMIIDIVQFLNDLGAAFATKNLAGTTYVGTNSPVTGAPVSANH